MADVRGKGTSLTEILENKPGRGWRYNILTNTYVPPKDAGSPRGSKPSRIKSTVQKERIWLNVGGKLIEAQGSGGNYAKYSLVGEASRETDSVGNYLRKHGRDISEVGRTLSLFKDPEKARASMRALQTSPGPAAPDNETGWKRPETNTRGVKYIQVPALKRAITADDISKLSAAELKAVASELMGESVTHEIDELERKLITEHLSGRKRRRSSTILTGGEG